MEPLAGGACYEDSAGAGVNDNNAQSDKSRFDRGAAYVFPMKLFELGRVSSGAAAALTGMPRSAFLAQLGE